MTDDLTDREHALRERIHGKLGDPPERWKAIEDMTPADHEARQRGERVESDEFREYERTVRRAAGLDTDPGELTAADHDRRKYGDREDTR